MKHLKELFDEQKRKKKWCIVHGNKLYLKPILYQIKGYTWQHKERSNVSGRKKLHKMRNGGHQFLASDKLMTTMVPNLEPN